MSRFNQYSVRRTVPRPWEVHPIWRGIGCLFIILIPVISFAGAISLVRQNFKSHWIELPQELINSFALPTIGRIYVADLFLAVIFMIIGFGLMTVVYSILIRLFGPSRYGPMDSPPLRRQKRRR